MTTSNQISPGMTIKVGTKVYRVESSVKVTVTKGTPFVKTKLRNLKTDEIIEKNFKLDQAIEEVFLVEHQLEYLYPEDKEYLFLDIGNLEQVKIDSEVLSESIDYLKEGVQLKAMFYGDTVFSVELPQFLELMVVKTQANEERVGVSNNTKEATLETGAKIQVPLFIEVGDVIKVDVQTNEYIQRI
jgi:elongation factor P